jgi:hypothetical protein
VNAISKIRPPDLPDDGQETSFTDWLNANGIIRAGWNGHQWNVNLRGGRFATGASIEEALISIGGEA